MRATALTFALLALLITAPAASASYDPIAGGTARLVLDKRFATFLGKAGVKISVTAGATERGRRLTFPVSGGILDPTAGKGEMENEGTITFRSARSRVLIRKLVVKTASAPLVGKVGGSQLKIATSARIDSKRDGFDTDFSAVELQLTEKVATRLNKKLRPRQEFRAGQLVGSLATETRPLLTAIVPIGKATLVFDSAFVAKLDRRFVSINPIFPAEHQGPTFTLPIIPGGTLAPDASQGTLRTGGDVEFLRLGAGQVFWHELWFDLGTDVGLSEVDVEPAPTFPGKLGQIQALALGVGAVNSVDATRTIGLSGVPLTLPGEIAGIFNRAFAEGEEDFKAGETVGSLAFAAQAQ
ncbi:MAG TPA: hypothetical protein VFJ61_11935 [Solirubrobacterales bacterium]|nr:hypothetical protein [Solirubrobacterales bacterium]